MHRFDQFVGSEVIFPDLRFGEDTVRGGNWTSLARSLDRNNWNRWRTCSCHSLARPLTRSEATPTLLLLTTAATARRTSAAELRTLRSARLSDRDGESKNAIATHPARKTPYNKSKVRP